MGKRDQLSILDQWTSQSNQVSRSTERVPDFIPNPRECFQEALAENPSSQVDTDANATCKSGTWHLGYKGHIGMNTSSKLIRRVAFTPASAHDSRLIDQLVSEDERSLFGDKAYSKDALKQVARGTAGITEFWIKPGAGSHCRPPKAQPAGALEG